MPIILGGGGGGGTVQLLMIKLKIITLAFKLY